MIGSVSVPSGGEINMGIQKIVENNALTVRKDNLSIQFTPLESISIENDWNIERLFDLAVKYFLEFSPNKESFIFVTVDLRDLDGAYIYYDSKSLDKSYYDLASLIYGIIFNSVNNVFLAEFFMKLSYKIAEAIYDSDNISQSISEVLYRDTSNYPKLYSLSYLFSEDFSLYPGYDFNSINDNVSTIYGLIIEALMSNSGNSIISDVMSMSSESSLNLIHEIISCDYDLTRLYLENSAVYDVLSDLTPKHRYDFMMSLRGRYWDINKIDVYKDIQFGLNVLRLIHKASSIDNETWRNESSLFGNGFDYIYLMIKDYKGKYNKTSYVGLLLKLRYMFVEDDQFFVESVELVRNSFDDIMDTVLDKDKSYSYVWRDAAALEHIMKLHNLRVSEGNASVPLEIYYQIVDDTK